MNLFLKIAKEKYTNYMEEVMYLIGKGHGIIEFCVLPVFDKSYKVNKKTKQELQKIVDNLNQITEILTEFKQKSNF